MATRWVSSSSSTNKPIRLLQPALDALLKVRGSATLNGMSNQPKAGPQVTCLVGAEPHATRPERRLLPVALADANLTRAAENSNYEIARRGNETARRSVETQSSGGAAPGPT